MALIELEGDVLTGDAEALIIAVDGQHPRMLGNLGQKFMAQVLAQPNGQDHWARIVREARYPIDEGIAHAVYIDFLPETEFKWLIFMSMYNHYNDADPESRLRMNWAYANAVGACLSLGIPSVATALYRGGSRSDDPAAMAALKRAAAMCYEVEVKLYRPSRVAAR